MSKLQRIRAAILFLFFREKDPKHHVIEGLSALHAVVTGLFCFLVPSIVFLYSIQYGILGLFIGETLLVLGLLEFLHVLYDR